MLILFTFCTLTVCSVNVICTHIYVCLIIVISQNHSEKEAMCQTAWLPDEAQRFLGRIWDPICVHLTSTILTGVRNVFKPVQYSEPFCGSKI